MACRRLAAASTICIIAELRAGTKPFLFMIASTSSGGTPRHMFSSAHVSQPRGMAPGSSDMPGTHGRILASARLAAAALAPLVLLPMP
jgi:hypothetical protein